MEQKVDDIKDDIQEIKDILKNQEKRFITRAEAKAANWVFGVVLAVLGLWVSFKDHIK